MLRDLNRPTGPAPGTLTLPVLIPGALSLCATKAAPQKHAAAPPDALRERAHHHRRGPKSRPAAAPRP